MRQGLPTVTARQIASGSRGDEEATFSVNREAGDEELGVIRKGFAILKGEKLNV